MSTEARCWQCKEVVTGFKAVCWTCLAEVESLRQRLRTFLDWHGGGPRCNGLHTGHEFCEFAFGVASQTEETK